MLTLTTSALTSGVMSRISLGPPTSCGAASTSRRSALSLEGLGKIRDARATHPQGHCVNRSQLERLLRLVARTEDEEISCTTCFDLLPTYVDLEVTGEDPGAQGRLFRQHLDQCVVCREEYEALRELIRLEPEGP